MKFAHLEAGTNKLLGWYDSEIHTDIPIPNIKVSEKVWQAAIDITANCYENKKFIHKDFRTSTEIDSARVSMIKAKAGKIILDRYPAFKQSNAQLGIYGQQYLSDMVAFISNIIEQSNKLEVSGTSNDFIIGD